MNISAASSTAKTFVLPDLGEGLTEAEVLQWHVAPGDEVQVDQVVVTVETAKASVDVPCPYAGQVLTLHGEPGAVLQVGEPLLSVGVETSVAGARSGSGNVLVGYGTSETRRSGRRRVNPLGRPGSKGSAGTVAAEPSSAVPAAAAGTAPSPVQVPRVISPVVRKLATDNSLDLEELAPSGPGNVIRRADVEAALELGGGYPAHQMPVSPGPFHTDHGNDIRIPLRGLRKTIADKLTASRREIPEATTWVDVDATELMAAKNELKGLDPAAGIGLLALFARICVAGLTRFPELNSRVDLKAQEIVQIHDINLSFAAQSPRGLVVPVVHGAREMTTTQLAAALRELTGLARDGKLSPAQLTGGTFTLNNYGVFGTDGATPIINYPEAAMLGVGRIIVRPWAYQGQVTLRKVTQLGLTFDHRVCDGASAGGFLRFVADCVERPTSLLAFL